MNLLSSLLNYVAQQIAALRTADSTLGGRMTTAEDDIDSLEAQFTTVVSAVTTDTEVTNIRVGDDGVTYPTAGKSVRTQFSNVKSDLSAIRETSRNLIVDVLAGYTISASGVFASNASKDMYIAPITQGEQYTFTSDETPIYAFFSTLPTAYTVAYDTTRHTDSNTFTAPITGYVAFRTTSTYAYAQLEKGTTATPYISPTWVSAIDLVSRGEIDAINDVIDGEYTDITTGAPTSGSYYTATIGEAIATASGNGYIYSPINLSNYVGKKVRVSFESTNTGSMRAVAMCDSNGITNETYVEAEIISKGYCDLAVSASAYMLYISYGLNVSGLTVKVVDLKSITNIIESEDAVYVSATNGSNNNSGSKYAPFATLQKAIDSGAETVRVEAGEYVGFYVSKRDKPLVIMLSDFGTYNSVSQQYVDKIKITTGVGTADRGIQAVDCASITLNDVWVDGVIGDCAFFQNVGFVHCLSCVFSNNTGSNVMGLLLRNCNAIIENCLAYGIDRDGFNIHGLGDSTFINCVSHDNGDDGISHHDGCTGNIIGGEFYNNVKGGIISPYGGSLIDVSGAYCHDNGRWGIYAGFTDNSLPTSKGRISNCVMKNNTEHDLVVSNAEIVAWNNIYDTSDIIDSTFIEF